MINKAIIYACIVTTQLLYIPDVLAKKSIAECQKLKTDEAEISSCLDSVKKLADRELQTWVNNHTFNLEEKALVTGRHSALKMFKRSQSNFITFRDNNCRWQYLAISPDKGANLAFKQCYIRLTQSRIKELSEI